MAGRFVVVANMHVGVLHPSVGGMELSAADAVAALRADARRAHRVYAVAPQPRFKARGNGSTLGAQNERLLGEALSGFGLRASDVVFDHTDARVPAMVCAEVGARHVRVVRLNPDYPVYASTAHLSQMAVHISEFAMQRDRVHAQRRLVRDYIRVGSGPWLEQTSRRPFLVSVGRVTKSKGHHLALALAKALGLPLTIVGPILDREYGAHLQKAGCRLVGAISRTRTLGLIRASRGLLWMPTEQEPGGRVVGEALLLGVRVWGRPYGLIADIVERGEPHTVVHHRGQTVIHVPKAPQFLPKSPSAVARAYWSIFHEVTRRPRS